MIGGRQLTFRPAHELVSPPDQDHQHNDVADLAQ
jgi:hypothetical protein